MTQNLLLACHSLNVAFSLICCLIITRIPQSQTRVTSTDRKSIKIRKTKEYLYQKLKNLKHETLNLNLSGWQYEKLPSLVVQNRDNF